MRIFVVAGIVACSLWAQYQARPTPPPYVFTAQEKSQIESGLADLGKRIAAIRQAKHDPALLADVEIYQKAVAWALRYPEEIYNRNYLDHTQLVLERGLARAAALSTGQAPWTTARGHVARTYVSRVDGSLQPYAVVVPATYNASRPIRLDLVLHGRNATLSEASFIATHEAPKTPDPYSDRIELHVFGRTNNAYRWAGEADVFEALAAVRKNYRIDPDRIVLRGFSMGGAGTWHIGLHYPSDWAGIEAGAGFNETIDYAKQRDLRPEVRSMLHIYDAMDYARNVFDVPTVGYGGELDPQLRASVNIQQQLQREGINLSSLRARFLVGPKTEHRFHPESKKESDAFLDSQLPRRVPDEIQFVTYTTRYNRCAWVTINALDRHYERTEVMGKRSTAGVELTTKNVAQLRLDGSPKKVTLDGQVVSSPSGVYAKHDGKWGAANGTAAKSLRKIHGLQGPVDDAFMDSFLLVTPTGTPKYPQLATTATARLERFRKDYAKWMRADPRETRDRAVTPAQLKENNLILFGDPGSNKLIGQIASKLPVRWSGASFQVGGQTYKADSHLLILVAPNPLNPNRYVVLNSGHTFGETEFKGTNALLYPRVGDWAVFNAGGELVATGLFNENWAELH